MQENIQTRKTRPAATDRLCRSIYKDITLFPIPKEPIRYPKIEDQPETLNIYRYTSTIHDLIYTNMKALIPNIEMGYYYEHSTNDIELWIKTTKTYMDLLNRNMQKKCDIQQKKLNYLREQEAKSEKLSIEKLNQLPEDIINTIYQYLLPETKTKLLIVRYPEIKKALEKITSENLKKYLNHVNNTYMQKIFQYNNKYPDRFTCIKKTPTFYLSFSKKEDGVKQITTLFDTLQKAIPKTPEYNRYFQDYAYQLLRSMIYIGYYKPNLRKNPKKNQNQ
jgi:hypothetical protein